jgi:putative peptide zinc metalloprotease protein
VSAAGIMVELAIAAVALAVWVTVQPGAVRDVALVTIFVCSLSTLLFNANPLLRFDGYYILADALNLPNLASRSRAWWQARLQRLVLGGAPAGALEPARGERKWLEAYAPLALVNGLVIAAIIVLWVGSVSVVLGILIGVYAAFAWVLRPLWAMTRRLLRDSAPGAQRRRAGVVLTATGALVFTLLFAVPVPFHTTAQGVIWIPEQAQVRPQVEGFIRELPARDGERVEAGQVLLVLDDPALHSAREVLHSRLEACRPSTSRSCCGIRRGRRTFSRRARERVTNSRA